MSGCEHTYCIGAIDLVVGDIIDSHDGYRHQVEVVGVDEDLQRVTVRVDVLDSPKEYLHTFDADADVRIVAQ